MKILSIYVIIVNLILFDNCRKNKESNLLIQSIMFFLPILMLALYVLKIA